MAKAKTTETLKLSKNALTVLAKRYLKRDSDGKTLETPAEMFHRVAQTINSAEPTTGKKKTNLEPQYYQMMTNLDFLPNSPTLMNAGRELGSTVSLFCPPCW